MMKTVTLGLANPLTATNLWGGTKNYLYLPGRLQKTLKKTTFFAVR